MAIGWFFGRESQQILLPHSNWPLLIRRHVKHHLFFKDTTIKGLGSTCIANTIAINSILSVTTNRWIVHNIKQLGQYQRILIAVLLTTCWWQCYVAIPSSCIMCLGMWSSIVGAIDFVGYQLHFYITDPPSAVPLRILSAEVLISEQQFLLHQQKFKSRWFQLCWMQSITLLLFSHFAQPPWHSFIHCLLMTRKMWTSICGPNVFCKQHHFCFTDPSFWLLMLSRSDVITMSITSYWRCTTSSYWCLQI